MTDNATILGNMVHKHNKSSGQIYIVYSETPLKDDIHSAKSYVIGHSRDKRGIEDWAKQYQTQLMIAWAADKPWIWDMNMAFAMRQYLASHKPSEIKVGTLEEVQRFLDTKGLKFQIEEKSGTTIIY